MSARTRLLAQLEDEIADGYPEPWWPQDRCDAVALDLPMGQMRALLRLFDLLADAAVEKWGPCWASNAHPPVPLRAVS